MVTHFLHLHLALGVDDEAVGLLHGVNAHLEVLMVHAEVQGGGQGRPERPSVVVLVLLCVLHLWDLFLSVRD